MLEKFKSNHNNLYISLVIFVALIIFTILEQGIQRNVLYGGGLIMLYACFSFIGDISTYLMIENSKTLISKVFLGRNFKTDIFQIIKVDRTSVFVFKGWGSRLQIHFYNEHDQEEVRVVQESVYDPKTIKSLLKRLKEISPSIKLHPQYQDLIDGKIEDEDDFKKLPIQGSVE